MVFWLLVLAPLPYIEGSAPPKPVSQESLPSLELHLPGLVRANHLSNGYIDVAHILLQVPPDTPPPGLLHEAQEALQKALNASAHLAEVDISIYPAPYAPNRLGLPLFTASIPRSRIQRGF